MKLQAFTIKVSRMMGLLVLMSILGLGCAKKSEGDQAAVIPPVSGGALTPGTPSGTGSDRGADWNSGATAVLNVDAPIATTLNNYAATHPVNDPTDIRISVNLKNVGSSVDGENKTIGKVFISYLDNNLYYNGRFYTQDLTNPTGNLATSGTYYPGWHHAAYNTWFVDPRTQKRSFHGFYQDQYGAVMIIIDNVSDQGDGAGATSGSGSIWFKNFAQSQYTDCGTKSGSFSWPASSNSCQGIWVVPSWFRINGPYDTRTFLEDANNGLGDIKTTSVLYPSESHFYTKDTVGSPYMEQAPARGWRRLGTFSSLNIAKAFNQ